MIVVDNHSVTHGFLTLIVLFWYLSHYLCVNKAT